VVAILDGGVCAGSDFHRGVCFGVYPQYEDRQQSRYDQAALEVRDLGACATAASTVLGLFATFLFEMIAYAPSQLLAETAQHQRAVDEQNIPKPEPRRFGYQEARILIPTILDFPRPCAFRVIAAPENLNLRGDFVTLAQTSIRNISQCELVEDPRDSDPGAFEDKLDYPNGSVVIRAKLTWIRQEDDLVNCFSQMGFHQAIHGKELSETDKPDVEVVFGTGALW
jgi:hypothetical protein